MTFARLALRSLVHYRRTHAAVALGVAAAVAVLAGSLIVGSSVRRSLLNIAAERLGATSVAVGATHPFTDELAARVSTALGAPVTPLLALTGVVTHESSSRRSSRVNVYAVDARFFAFHGIQVAPPERSGALISTDLARELGAADNDAIVLRIARPTDIPIDSLHGRREDAGRSIRLSVGAILRADQIGDFALTPAQGPARTVFVSLERLQRDLDIDARVNALLVSGIDDAARVRAALAANATATDLGLVVESLPDKSGLVVEAKSGLIADAVADSLRAIAAESGFGVTPVLTWLATSMTVNDRAVPYSLVTALGPDAAGDRELADALSTDEPGPPPIVLNEWAARDLKARAGDQLEMEYFRWSDEGRLVTEYTRFRVADAIPMRGLAVDRRWAPDYPGITTAGDITEWDPPFPIDLKKIRKQDEAYWDQYRTAPKAFLPLSSGQPLWRTRHGQLTSLRFRRTDAAAGKTQASPDLDALRTAIARRIDPVTAGFTVADVWRRAASASAGATDFGAYFSYFSFFLMVAALLLAALFFRLSIEQRAPEMGVLRATGFSPRDLRRAVLIESGWVVGIGSIAGVVLAIGWAALMMLALRTWWVDAVGTTRLRLHVGPLALAAGTIATALAAFAAVALTVRALRRTTPRAQIAGLTRQTDENAPARVWLRWLAPIALVAALLLSGLSLAGAIPAAGGFFGAGALILAGGLAAYRSWLTAAGHRDDATAAGIHGLISLAMRNASWRPGRSLTVAGLVAAAVFLLVSVDSFRKTVAPAGDRTSGTGGFALIAESAIPIVHDLQDPAGREAVGLLSQTGAAAMKALNIFSLRLRPGDDASCLNLYQPRQPRIAGVPERLMRDGRFTFARSIATGDSAQDPWALLGDPDANGVVPAIADQTSLQYVLHAAVGDVITVDADTARPLQLRIVASLADSVLQGELLIAESAFRSVFPEIAGYRFFLVDVENPTPERIGEVTTELETGLEAFGFDAESTASRLEAFHRVENTYLSTFQALGGLGLVLGCVGLIAVVLRNVLERRRELALLGAAGFTRSRLQALVALEHIAIVGIGLVIGLVAAAVAVGPVVASRTGAAPWRALVWVLPVVVAALAAAYGATRNLRKLPLVASLRSE